MARRKPKHVPFHAKVDACCPSVTNNPNDGFSEAHSASATKLMLDYANYTNNVLSSMINMMEDEAFSDSFELQRKLKSLSLEFLGSIIDDEETVISSPFFSPKVDLSSPLYVFTT